MTIKITEKMTQYENCRIEITSFIVSLIKKYPELNMIDRTTITSEVVYSNLNILRRLSDD